MKIYFFLHTLKSFFQFSTKFGNEKFNYLSSLRFFDATRMQKITTTTKIKRKNKKKPKMKIYKTNTENWAKYTKILNEHRNKYICKGMCMSIWIHFICIFIHLTERPRNLVILFFFLKKFVLFQLCTTDTRGIIHPMGLPHFPFTCKHIRWER